MSCAITYSEVQSLSNILGSTNNRDRLMAGRDCAAEEINMCIIVDVEKHQKRMCEEVYRIAKKLAKAHNYEELSKEDRYDCNLIKGDFSKHPPQTRWWVGAAKRSLERLVKERQY